MLVSNFSTIQQQQEKMQGYRIFTVSHFKLRILYGWCMKCKFKQPSLSVLARVANQCVMGDYRLLYIQVIYVNFSSNLKIHLRWATELLLSVSVKDSLSSQCFYSRSSTLPGNTLGQGGTSAFVSRCHPWFLLPTSSLFATKRTPKW